MGSHTASRAVWLFFATPKDVQPFCGHRPGLAECEQWSACVDLQNNERGESPVWWFAEYPASHCGPFSGDSDDCGVEHVSRPCTPKEKAEDVAKGRPADEVCARPSANNTRDVVGQGGGPAGIRTVCVAPSEARRARGEAACRRWELRLDDWSPR